MAGGEDLLTAMRDNPRDWRIADVERLCRAFGLVCLPPRGGSHYKIAHPLMPSILTIPSRRPIKPVYIRDLVRMVDAVREQDR